MAQRRCTKCGRLLADTDFYTSNNIERFPPDGKMAECKKCWTMHVDNWDPDTYKPLLEQLDIPYIKPVWDQLLEKFLSKNDASKITTTSVLGRYVSTMKLSQWRKYRWADTEELAAKEEEKLRSALVQQGYTGEDLELEMKRDFGPQRPVSDLRQQNDDPAADPSSIVEETAYDRELADKLSEDEIVGLKLKWGDAYRLSELVRMEKLYADMMASYDIQTASHKDILIFLCKTSLKLNQLLDAGDIAEAQKVAKMYDTLLKSGKFAAAQAKDEETDFVDSVGELVTLAEEQGFIPKYYISQPNDMVDQTIMDMQRYTYNLVTQETSLGTMLEAAMKQIEQDRENEKNVSTEEEDDNSDLFNYDENPLKVEDFQSFDEFEAELAAADEEEEAGDS